MGRVLFVEEAGGGETEALEEVGDGKIVKVLELEGGFP